MTEKFWIRRLFCKCKVCNNKFYIDNSNDNQIVKVHLEGATDTRWIKMYGENGYLDLIEKFTGTPSSRSIDMATVVALEKRLNSVLNVKITFDKGIRTCPSCNSKSIVIISERIFETNQLLLWNVDLPC